ncbi:MAG: metallohydrolase [Candidatus Pacebacteria bacterium]|nr:metallohydrolase [Candidatus Paceibacterota bacterium]
MAGKITFFPVDNGDMTLIKLDDERETTILIDINIRQKAEDENDDTRDVSADLRERLNEDKNKRPYVDVFVLSHPDQDHCSGADRNLHLGPLAEYEDEPGEGEEKKIVVREIWSSPVVFRRASKGNPLCADAKAVSKEAKRRVKAFRDNNEATSITDMAEGDRIRIIGEDEQGKTDDILSIVSKIDDVFCEVNGQDNGFTKMTVLGPLPAGEAEGDDGKLASNRSSIILQYHLWPKITAGTDGGYCLYLTGGDAGVEVWDRLDERHKAGNFEPLEYDLLLSPHHCSWRSLSHDSWSDNGEAAKVSEQARHALSRIREVTRGYIVASSKPILEEEPNPPHERAKREYVDIVDDKERFYCTGEYPSEDVPGPLEFSITSNGFEPPRKTGSSVSGAAAALGATTSRVGHGEQTR